MDKVINQERSDEYKLVKAWLYFLVLVFAPFVA